MEEKTRWNVTFTKHLKQKRKVYHDGFLNFYNSSKKLTLYDESESLLESRFLSKDEVVSPGETLTFNAYLVDVGDQVGGPKDRSESISQAADQGFNHKSSSLFRPKFNRNAVSCEKKPKLENKMPIKSLSPSHKMIRVFRKREVQRYGMPPCSLPKTNISVAGKVPSTSVEKVIESREAAPSTKSLHHGEIQNRANSAEQTNANPTAVKITNGCSTRKPLRDTNQILSILQNPNVGKSTTDKHSDQRMSLANQCQDPDATGVYASEDGCLAMGIVPHDGHSELPETRASGEYTMIEGSVNLASSAATNDNSQIIQDSFNAPSCQVSSCPPSSSKSNLKAVSSCPSFDLGI